MMEEHNPMLKQMEELANISEEVQRILSGVVVGAYTLEDATLDTGENRIVFRLSVIPTDKLKKTLGLNNKDLTN